MFYSALRKSCRVNNAVACCEVRLRGALKSCVDIGKSKRLCLRTDFLGTSVGDWTSTYLYVHIAVAIVLFRFTASLECIFVYLGRVVPRQVELGWPLHSFSKQLDV